MRHLKFLLIFCIFILLLATAVSAEGWCYQESANESTVCGGIDTGNYSFEGTWDDSGVSSNVIDGNWSTGGWGAGGTTAYFYVNYTKPESSWQNLTEWQLRDGGVGFNPVNVTITSDCWDYNDSTLILKGSADGSGGNSKWYCKNLTEWHELRSHSGTSGSLFEDGMYWYINSSDSCTYSSGDWNVTASDACEWTSNIDVLGNAWTISGSGTVTITNIDISNVDSLTLTGSTLTMNGGSVTVE